MFCLKPKHASVCGWRFSMRQAGHRYGAHLGSSPHWAGGTAWANHQQRCACAAGNKDSLGRGCACISKILPQMEQAQLLIIKHLSSPENLSSISAERVSDWCLYPLQQDLVDTELDVSKGVRQMTMRYYLYIAKSNFIGFIILKSNFDINSMYLILRALTWF